MARKTQVTTKFRASTEEEAENVVLQVEHETEGIISKKAIQRKEHKDGVFYEVTVTEDLTKKRARKEMM